MSPVLDSLIQPDTIHEITSGGEHVKGALVPALFATKEQAVDAFDRELVNFLALSGAAKWKYVSERIADRFHITIQDAHGGHRFAEDRWSVSAKVGLLKAAQAAA